MKTAYLLWVALYFLGLIIRAVYEQLKRDGRINPKSMITFTIVFFAMCLMWASWLICALWTRSRSSYHTLQGGLALVFF